MLQLARLPFFAYVDRLHLQQASYFAQAAVGARLASAEMLAALGTDHGTCRSLLHYVTFALSMRQPTTARLTFVIVRVQSRFSSARTISLMQRWRAYTTPTSSTTGRSSRSRQLPTWRSAGGPPKLSGPSMSLSTTRSWLRNIFVSNEICTGYPQTQIRSTLPCGRLRSRCGSESSARSASQTGCTATFRASRRTRSRDFRRSRELGLWSRYYVHAFY